MFFSDDGVIVCVFYHFRPDVPDDVPGELLDPRDAGCHCPSNLPLCVTPVLALRVSWTTTGEFFEILVTVYGKSSNIFYVRFEVPLRSILIRERRVSR